MLTLIIKVILLILKLIREVLFCTWVRRLWRNRKNANHKLFLQNLREKAKEVEKDLDKQAQREIDKASKGDLYKAIKNCAGNHKLPVKAITFGGNRNAMSYSQFMPTDMTLGGNHYDCGDVALPGVMLADEETEAAVYLDDDDKFTLMETKKPFGKVKKYVCTNKAIIEPTVMTCANVKNDIDGRWTPMGQSGMVLDVGQDFKCKIEGNVLSGKAIEPVRVTIVSYNHKDLIRGAWITEELFYEAFDNYDWKTLNELKIKAISSKRWQGLPNVVTFCTINNLELNQRETRLFHAWMQLDKFILKDNCVIDTTNNEIVAKDVVAPHPIYTRFDNALQENNGIQTS